MLGTPTSTSKNNVEIESHYSILEFLESKGYSKTLESFKSEASEIFNAGSLKQKKSLDLRIVVEDYLTTKLKNLAVKTTLSSELVSDAFNSSISEVK